MYSLTPKVWCKYLDNDGVLHYVIGATKPTYLFLNDYSLCWYTTNSHLHGWLIVQVADNTQQKFPLLSRQDWQEALAELESNSYSV